MSIEHCFECNCVVDITMPSATFQPAPPAGNCRSIAGRTTKERREPRTNSSAASYAFSPMAKGINDDNRHYDQAN
jgi:hypothetical protein